MHSPLEHFGLFTATMILSTIFLIDFGWFREQFCLIACPYGRMQSVMMDENSLTIAYDKKRGEPRRGSPGVVREAEGDCINCYNCVKVCPTGIDIRHGTQLECIACTNCIDACDEIMTKIKKPTGLIRYSSENELNGIKKNKINIRSLIYVSISLIFITSFFIFLNKSTNLQMVFIRGATPFSMNQTEVTNKFDIKLNHQGDAQFKLLIRLQDPKLVDKINIVTPQTPLTLVEHEKKIIVFFRFDKSILENGSKKVIVELFDINQEKVVSMKEVNLVGPIQ
jgi:cytochrome c oxidase accessory protein FixG